MPEVKYLATVLYTPTLKFISHSALLVEHKEKASVSTRIYSLGNYVWTFDLACITSVAQRNEKLKLTINLSKSFFCVYRVILFANLIVKLPIFTCMILIKKMVKWCIHCSVKYFIAEINSWNVNVYFTDRNSVQWHQL
jgi:hypothetical protein